MEYRDRTRDVVNEMVSQAKSKADELKEGVAEMTEDLILMFFPLVKKMNLRKI